MSLLPSSYSMLHVEARGTPGFIAYTPGSPGARFAVSRRHMRVQFTECHKKKPDRKRHGPNDESRFPCFAPISHVSPYNRLKFGPIYYFPAKLSVGVPKGGAVPGRKSIVNAVLSSLVSCIQAGTQLDRPRSPAGPPVARAPGGPATRPG
jgi:hypothetical protein